jgi:hypothetical protein
MGGQTFFGVEGGLLEGIAAAGAARQVRENTL